MENKNEEKVQSVSLEEKDVKKSYWLWQFFSHANYNYERMQGTAVAMAMAPIIKKLYPNQEEKAAGLKRHLTFFNTDPNFGAVILGGTIAMEEQRANGAPLTDEAINSFKTGMMGPMAGIGDSIVQGVVIPIMVAIGISMATKGNVFGSLFVLIALPIVLMAIAYNSWMYGYRLGTNAISGMLADGRMKTWISAAGIVGCTVMGALIPNYVNVKSILAFNIGNVPFNLQENLFDAIMPSLLPLAVTILIYFLSTKNVKTWKIMVGVVVVAFVLGALGILG